MTFQCVHCGTVNPPHVKKRMSGAGWALFIVLLLFCIPLCWLPFVLDGCQENEYLCSGCGIKLG
ncbi:MAG: LITAF-like zinc ribbon domain-containing protein [Firmicutes bacterium]|nr:LITAF-like zinc ribbon domain-containing protein [Bacillota bacterium]